MSDKAEEKTAQKSPIAKLAFMLGVKTPGNTIESFLIPDEDSTNEQQLRFLDTMELQANEIIAEIELANARIIDRMAREEARQAEVAAKKAAGEEITEEDEQPLEELKEFSQDGCFYIGTARMETIAFGMLFPPVKEGRKLTVTDVVTIIKEKGITYGINGELISNVVEKDKFFKLFIIARGAMSKDGTDGVLEDLFSRSNEAHFVSDSNDIVDYKNLNIIQKVEKGGVICRYTPPVPAIDGISVKGEVIKGKEGKSFEIPAGQNTEMNAATNELLAACDGNVSFVGGKFNVFNVYEVKENVDNTTGNIEMNGDVVVRGSVLEGFEITATGNITVYGYIEGAIILAGGSVHLNHGMNGNLKGQIYAEGDVESKYLENCSVFAKGNVTSGSIVNCRVNASSVTAQGKPGAIIGGEINVFHDITARVIGNDSTQQTKLCVGTDIELLNRQKELRAEIGVLTKSIEDTEKNVKYLESRDEELTPEYKNLLKNLKYKVSADKIRLAKSDSEMKKIQAEQSSSVSMIVADKIFPIVRVEITGVVAVISDPIVGSRIFKQDGEIQFGSK